MSEAHAPSFGVLLTSIRQRIQDLNCALQPDHDAVVTPEEAPPEANKKECPPSVVSKSMTSICVTWASMTTLQHRHALTDYVQCEFGTYSVKKRISIIEQLVQCAKILPIQWNGQFISSIRGLVIDTLSSKGNGNTEEEEKDEEEKEEEEEEEEEVCIRLLHEKTSTSDEDDDGVASFSKVSHRADSVNSMRSRLQLEKGVFFAR
jgi:hypothetical protein